MKAGKSAQIEPKSQFLFHKILSPRDFFIMTLSAESYARKNYDFFFMLRTIFQSELMTRLFFGSLLHKSVIYCGINILLRYFQSPAHSCGQPLKPTVFVNLCFCCCLSTTYYIHILLVTSLIPNFFLWMYSSIYSFFWIEII